MNTRIHCILAFATACAIATANEALDILEGHTQPVDITTVGQENNAPFEPAWPSWQTTTFDPVWAKATLLDDPENPKIQKLALTGFLDTQLFNGRKGMMQDQAGVESANDPKWDRETSRARLGARMRAYGNTDINATVEWYSASLTMESGALRRDYDGDVFFLDELSARTEFTENTSVTYGKFRPGYTAEFRQDIAASPYPDRSLLADFLTPDPTLGLKVNYRSGDIEYGYGWFMADSDEWMPNIEGDGMFSFSVAQHLNPGAASKSRTTVYADYIHNFNPSRPEGFDKSTGQFANRIVSTNDLTQILTDLDFVVDGASIDDPALRHLASVGFHSENEQWSVVGDIMIAKGDLDIGGITLAPSRWIIPGWLKATGRYNLTVLDQDPTITMHTIFVGLNAHLYRDRLLLMTGFERWIVEQSEGEAKAEADFWHTGVRASF
jgi:hypothetical protein